MKVTQEKLPASRVGLEIEVPAEMSQRVYDKTLQKFARNANIPGFRKGKVPTKILTSQYGRQLRLAALEELVEDSIKQAIDQEKIDALGNIQLVSPFEDLMTQYQPGAVLTISASVDVPPEASLKQYTGLTIQAEEIPYRPEQVDEVLESYRERRATQVPVEGRPAQEKDLVLVDFKGVIAGETDEEGNPQEIPGGSATDFEVELSEGRFIPGFIEGIIGMNVGETKDVSATFPEEYPQDDVAGKEAIFTITLKEIKEKELPELDDDFAEDISEFETLAELRESLEKRYREDAESKTDANKQQAFLDELLKHLEVELPESLVRREVDQMITQTAMRLAEQGMDIKSMFTPEVIENLRERSRTDAVIRLQRTMALGEIAKQESLSVEQSDVDAKMEEVLEELKDTPNLDRDRLREVVEEDLLKEKIFSWLEEHNTVELVPEGTLQKDEEAADELEVADTATAVEATPEGAEAPAADVEVEVEAAAVEAPEAPPVEPEPAAEEEPEPKQEKSSRSKAAKADTESEEEAESAASDAEETEDQPKAKAKTSARKKTTRSKSSKDEGSENAEEE